jgi:hypothetical protein
MRDMQISSVQVSSAVEEQEIKQPLVDSTVMRLGSFVERKFLGSVK